MALQLQNQLKEQLLSLTISLGGALPVDDAVRRGNCVLRTGNSITMTS